MDREGLRMMSLRLSRVLEDIGVSGYIIARRRRTWLGIETIERRTLDIIGYGRSCFKFGSQSEGTTTPGMQSDIDTLMCRNSPRVILDWAEWQQGKDHFLVIKTEQSPPQHCWLQRLRPDLPFPVTHAMLPNDIECGGKVLHTNTFSFQLFSFMRDYSPSGEVVQHGPSRSVNENLDIVVAYKCARLPDECQILFQRPRPGHWPNPDILARARQTGVFLVPQGYTATPSRPSRCHSTALHVTPYDLYYPTSKWQWRFSTSMMERLLIFDFNTIQLKVYVFLKMLRKSFLKSIVGDRFSTFHMKTCMFFTIETYPPDIWREDNLVQCVIYCLTTLIRWLKIKYCPHYTIAGVSLFTGKLFQYEQNIIANTVTNMLTSNLQCCHFIEMDSLGAKLMALQLGVVISENKSRNSTNQTITSDLCAEYIGRCHTDCNHLMQNTNSCDLQQFVQATLQFIITLVNISEQGTAIQQESATFPLAYHRCNLASALASRCIYLGQPITQGILTMYRLSFDSDLLSTKLKFASMLYRSGQYEAAENCLSYCEGLLGPDVMQFCKCVGKSHIKPNKLYLENSFNKSNMEMLKKHSTTCIRFSRHDMCCIPEILRFEMFRTITEEDRQQRRQLAFYDWMDMAVVDCIPFLHYLQYLTYRQLNQHVRKLETIKKLTRYTVSNNGHDHFDTTLNMLGHCCELENWLNTAWIGYWKSLQFYPRNNAANWHVARLLHEEFNKRAYSTSS